MESQVQKLKLNVNNIKSYLIRSNKELKGLKVQKRDLFSRIEKKREFREEEKRIETPNLGIGAGFAKISSAVTSPVRSIFDQILDFFGLIALGIIVNKLPEIINTIDNFFNSDFIKGVSSILESIGTAFTNIGKFVGLIPEDKQNEYEKGLKDIDKKLDESTKDFDQFDKDTKDLDDTLSSLDKEYDSLDKDLTQKNDNNKSKNQWWDFLDVVPNEQPQQQAPSPMPEPPSGTGGPTGGPIPKPKPPEQKLSTGGTVRGDAKTDPIKNKPIHQPKQTPELKRSRRSAQDGFTGFGVAVNNISEAIGKDEENVKSFAELAEKIRILNVINSGISTTGRGTRPPGGDPGSNPPPSPSPASPTPGAGGPVIQFYGGQGRDRSGEPGIDFSFADYKNNYSIFDGVVTETGKIYGAGYGNVVVVRSTDPSTGKQFDALYAHFPDNGISVAEGQTVSAGAILGKVGWDESRGAPMPGAGNMTGPHTSVDFYEPNTRRGQVTGRYSNTGYIQNLIINGANKNVKDLVPKKTSSVPKSSPPGPVISSTGNGGKRTLNTSGQGIGGQSVVIYALQPIETYVPFPYPMPVPQETAQSSPEPVKLPSIWRA